jgi:hypothetical protein
MPLNGLQGLRPREAVEPLGAVGNLILDQMLALSQTETLGRSADFRVQHISAFQRPTAVQFEPPVLRPGLVDAFVKTCQRWHLSPSDQIALLGYNGSEFLGRQLLEGRLLALPQDARDRVAYVLGISLGLGAMFNDSEEAELFWLRQLRPVLGGRSAIDFMLEGSMANLTVIAQMVAAERGL